ncbi:MAG TPA: carbonic anhydrase [Bacteroidia bacterium]|jgi:carbonic anhydrase|nr:carbonic anhydrase [Bacteroidia bacterium]
MENINNSYKKLLEGNKLFASSKQFEDKEYFKKLSYGQTPDYLWIGCSDSRVPANEITSTKSGEIFVHRNVANLVVHTDMNLLSVLEFAINNLKIKHIIVCGHYGCGGIQAALSNDLHGFVDNWLCNVKDVYTKYEKELSSIKELDKREDRLTELNVIEQVRNVAKTTVVQQAWKIRPLHIHGWVYGINNGLITDLCVIHDDQESIEEIYRFKV